jgi:hypothetical protein
VEKKTLATRKPKKHVFLAILKNKSTQLGKFSQKKMLGKPAPTLHVKDLHILIREAY